MTNPPSHIMMDRARREEMLWSNVRESLFQNDGGISPRIRCIGPNCTNVLMFPGIHTNDEINAVPTSQRETALIYPCGHMIGKRCADSWDNQMINLHPDGPIPGRACRICHYQLTFEPCGHHVQPFNLEDAFQTSWRAVSRKANGTKTTAMRQAVDTFMPQTLSEVGTSAFVNPNLPRAYALVCGFCRDKACEDNSAGKDGLERALRLSTANFLTNSCNLRGITADNLIPTPGMDMLDFFKYMERIVRGATWDRKIFTLLNHGLQV